MSTFEVEAARQLVRGLSWITGYRPLVAEDERVTVVKHGERPLRWRHHGLGMLQAELSESLRVHVWHPSLVSPAMAWPRCVHDHRFDIDSVVVVGAVRDVRPDMRRHPKEFSALPDLRSDGTVPHPTGHWGLAKVYEIEHAKNQDRMVAENGDTAAVHAKFLGDVILTRAYADHDYSAGTRYRIPRRVFHTTETDGLAVTVVHRYDFDDRLARVLCAPNSDVSAVSGIVRDDSAEYHGLVESVLREAAAAVAAL
jgi:hypothetical protein